jgi:hypothetical protein
MYLEKGAIIKRITTLAKPRILKTISVLSLCVGLFYCGGTSPRLGSLMSFEMEDQFRHSHSHADFKGRLNLVGLSNLKGVPFFLKDYVRGKFSQNAGEWALMDWKGLFADSYGFIAGKANVVVFDKEGELVHQAHFSECRPDQVLSLTAIIRGKLDGPPPRPSRLDPALGALIPF